MALGAYVKPTDEEKMQVVDALLNQKEQLDTIGSIPKDERSVVLAESLSVTSTALAMLLMERIERPAPTAKPPEQLELFTDLTPGDSYSDRACD